MRKVNLFIVGAARCGTTSLWRALNRHDEVCMPRELMFKEPAFFSDLKRNMNYRQYISLFQEATPERRIIGDASTAYLTDVSAAESIFKYNPDAKIVISLRNPADRAFSLYNWMVQEGYEYCGSFESALAMETRRMKKKIPNFFEPEYYWNFMYYHSGCYADQVKRFLVRFKDNVHIINFRSFVTDTETELERLCSFLGIKKIRPEQRKLNPSLRINYPKVQFFIRKIINVRTYLMTLCFHSPPVDKVSRDRMLRLIKKSDAVTVISRETRARLLCRYESGIRTLNRLTGMDFSEWLQ